MTMKTLLFFLCLFFSVTIDAQYLAVRARWTDTRLVPNDNPALPNSRENRLILYFYYVQGDGTATPASLTDFAINIQKEGLQYGSNLGGVSDSAGNNYPGYNFTAPRVVACYNTYNYQYVDCSPWQTTTYTVNGHMLDCGFIRVSYWYEDEWLPNGRTETFTAPNICLPYYFLWDPVPYYYLPGNLNFHWPEGFASGPYNWYSFVCNGVQQLGIRGLLSMDSTGFVTLPVRFGNESGRVNADCKVDLTWTNMTEADINHYEIERSDNGTTFNTVVRVNPLSNNGNRADYSYTDPALNTSGVMNYRIKAIENNGAHFYSKTIRVTACEPANNSKLKIYPNPANGGRFYLLVEKLPRGKYDVLMMNALGQMRPVTTLDHTGGTINKLFDLTWLTPGTYSLVLYSPDTILSEKVIILPH